ncbi:hypothetical protein MJG53_015673 [Ovis ammon polii x Ovis aries]|uniref:Uncharacterized protein n=2 Tax=Ovis TaxID=9935 RepID=A0A836CXI0_SHEEP|nr:hypothetical protein JEQ12_002410 [Ovis aries]KAI4566996.1 hypothetical protein MJG53_015673 [Ovis ammon polii x Ovis aries]
MQETRDPSLIQEYPTCHGATQPYAATDRAPQRPVDPEDSTEHAQEQRHLQEDQEQEVGAAQQGPVGDTGTDREPHP